MCIRDRILEEASKDKEEIIVAEINTEEDHLFRRNWGLFRDRRTDLYEEILIYPTAIVDEIMIEYDRSEPWKRVMQGHAAANIIPVVASNRVGSESVKGQTNGFYGRSFICDRSGKILEEASKDKEEIIVAEINTEEDHLFRRNWGLFRDR